MKLKLTVKVSGSSSFVDVAKRQLNRALSIAKARIVPLVTDRTLQLVAKQSPDMTKRYEKALAARGAIDVTEKDVTVTLSDPLIVANEKGAKGFDMKPKLLAKATKTSKSGGSYIDIPFKHKSAEIPSAVRAKMTKASKMSGGADVTHVSSTPGRSFTRKLQRGSVAQRLGLKPKKQQVQHKGGTQDNLMRKAKSGSRGGSYMTIRRVSSKSASTSWWHPGFKAQRIIEKVMPSIKRDVAVILRDAFVQARGG